MKDKQYYVHYSRRLGGSKKERLHISMFLEEVSLKKILCDDESKFEYIVHSATLVERGRSKDVN